MYMHSDTKPLCLHCGSCQYKHAPLPLFILSAARILRRKTTAHDVEMTAHDESHDMKDAAHGVKVMAHDESCDIKDAALGVEMTAHDEPHDESHETADAWK